MLSFVIRSCQQLWRSLYRRMLIDCRYAIQLQSVACLSPENHLELQMLLTEAHGVSIDSLRVLQETDELYTVVHANKIVACVFTKAVDWCTPINPYIVDPSGGPRTEDESVGTLQFCGVRALSVSPQHRRLGIASRLLKLIKKKASADRMLWIELHVDEKQDMSHECLLSMYRGLGFIVLPRPTSKEYLLLCMNY
jgi:hypothetical protein